MSRILFVLIATIIASLASSVPLGALPVSEQTRLQTIISRGDQEIDRRMQALTTTTQAIEATRKLSNADKQALSAEVTSATKGLTALKSTLDGATTLTSARTAVQSITADYRVYALLLPKVRLVKVADGQLGLVAKFDALSAQLLQRFAELKAEGKDTSGLEATLSNMNTKVTEAKAAAVSAQAKLMLLQPTDYNSDHMVLSEYREQLRTSRELLRGARQDVKTIVDSIKALTT